MGVIKGDKSVDIAAPIERCYAIAADVENAPEWQGSLRDVEVLEHDAEGRPVLVETESDAKVKSVGARLPPRRRGRGPQGPRRAPGGVVRPLSPAAPPSSAPCTRRSSNRVPRVR